MNINDLSREEIYAEIGKMISRFNNLECDICAKAVKEWLDENQIESKMLRLKTKRPNDFFIISKRLGINESITENGTHYGIEVFGKVFDNLSSTGMTREEWQKDFSCRSGSFIIDEI